MIGIKYSCPARLGESSNTIEKLIKLYERVGFEDERHIELRMELVRQVDEAEELIKDKDNLINKLKKSAGT